VTDSITRSIFERWTRAMSELDFEALRELIHPDYIGDWPQSGERVRGFEALRAILENYPGGTIVPIQEGSGRLMHAEEAWLMSPGYTVIPLAGGGAISSTHRTRYPDESVWYVVSFMTLKDGRVWRATTFFAPHYPAPEWRAHLVERIPDVEATAPER
jgi:hypothetical protein